MGQARWGQATPGGADSPHVWVAAVGDSGNGKSPGADCLLRDVLPELERKMIADYPDRLREWRASVEFARAADVGALQFLPDDEYPGVPGGLSGRPLEDQEIAEMLGDLRRTPLGLDERGEFRISLAGAQEKTALLYWDDMWHVPTPLPSTPHTFNPAI